MYVPSFDHFCIWKANHSLIDCQLSGNRIAEAGWGCGTWDRRFSRDVSMGQGLPWFTWARWMGGSVAGYPPCHRLYSSAKSSDCSYGRWQLNVVDVTCRWCLHDMTLFANPEASTFRQERGMNAQDVQFGACVGGI